MKKLLLLSLIVLFGCSKEDNSALIDSYTSQISSLNAQISQLNAQIAQSQSQITSLQSQVNSISGLEATIDNLNSQITDYQSQISSLQAEVNSLNSQVANNSSLQETIDSLNAQIASKNELIASLQAQIVALENNQTSSSTNTTSDTDNWPDYAAQGHTFKAIGIWRLYSVNGVPVSDSQRFNVKIYPDPLNPSLLTEVGNAADNANTGLVDFGESTGIGWSYSVDGSESYNSIRFNPELINGISFPDAAARANNTTYKRNGIRYFNEANPLKIEVQFLNNEVDTSIFPSGLNNALFYKITD